MRTSVMFKFRSSRVKSKPGSLYVQLIKSRKTYSVVIKGYKIYPCEWDEKNESFQMSTCNPARKRYLEEFYAKIMFGKKLLLEIIYDLENTRDSYTLEDVVRSYKFRTKGCILSTYAENVASEIETLQPRTARSYRTTAGKVKVFNGGNDISLDQITVDFVRRFETYMLRIGNKPNTSSYYCRNLRALVNRAIKDKLVFPQSTHPFSGVFTGNEKTEKRAISKDVIENLESFTLPEKEKSHLILAKDIFLLSYYLRGISFIDLAYLKKENIRNGCIVYTRHKTKQHFEVELTPKAMTILHKYQSPTNEFLLPLLQNDCSRKNYEAVLRRENIHLKQLSTLLNLNTPLTTYVARHSWASIAYAMGIPIDVISRGLGHDSIKTTLIYLKSFDYSDIHEANRKIICGEKSVA